jgi:hypothetical protein
MDQLDIFFVNDNMIGGKCTNQSLDSKCGLCISKFGILVQFYLLDLAVEVEVDLLLEPVLD